jgi:hypothetical protein
MRDPRDMITQGECYFLPGEDPEYPIVEGYQIVSWAHIFPVARYEDVRQKRSWKYK